MSVPGAALLEYPWHQSQPYVVAAVVAATVAVIVAVIVAAVVAASVLCERCVDANAARPVMPCHRPRPRLSGGRAAVNLPPHLAASAQLIGSQDRPPLLCHRDLHKHVNRKLQLRDLFAEAGKRQLGVTLVQQ